MADEAAGDLKTLESQGLEELRVCEDEPAIRAWYGKFLGDKGLIRAAQAKLGAIPKDQKAAYGQEFNRVKTALTTAYESKLAEVKEEALQASLTANPLDVTLPGRARPRGRLHPATQILRQIYCHLRRPGLPGLPHPRGRDGRDELRAAEHAAAPPGARHVGHVPHHDARRRAAHAHVARADPRDARGGRQADPRDPAGHVLPLRGDQHPQRDPVPPGRGAGDRRGRHDGRPEGDDHRVRPADVRPGAAGAHPVAATSRSPSRRSRWTSTGRRTTRTATG